jgi:hypothetical protein
MFLLRLLDALEEARVPFALVGGYAVALHGAPRGTVDIDLILKLCEKDFVAFEKTLRGLGLAPRLPVKAEELFRFREEWRKHRNLIAWSFVNPARVSEVVDVVLGEDLAKRKVVRKDIGGGRQAPVLALADLIEMKQAAGRPQDLEDVRALKALRGRA